jgi:hypothetical protein
MNNGLTRSVPPYSNPLFLCQLEYPGGGNPITWLLSTDCLRYGMYCIVVLLSMGKLEVQYSTFLLSMFKSGNCPANRTDKK